VGHWDKGREIMVERGVRQRCVISPLLFNLYSEFMIREAIEEIEGISIGGANFTDLRYADDAVLAADKKKKLQKMIDKLKVTCKEYGMDINVKKTKVMVVGGDGEENVSQTSCTLDGVPLERVTRYNYLDSWITDDARCEEDIRARVRMAEAAFWQNKEVMRMNIHLSTNLKILNSYVFSIASYGCEN